MSLSNYSSGGDSKIFYGTFNTSKNIYMSVFMLVFSGNISLYRGLPFQCSYISSDGTYQYPECECLLQYLDVLLY